MDNVKKGFTAPVDDSGFSPKNFSPVGYDSGGFGVLDDDRSTGMSVCEDSNSTMTRSMRSWSNRLRTSVSMKKMPGFSRGSLKLLAVAEGVAEDEAGKESFASPGGERVENRRVYYIYLLF